MVQRQRVTEEVFLERVGKDEYTILGEYKNTSTPVKIRHNICNYEWDVYPSNLISAKKKGNGCPRCTGKERYTTELFKQKVYDLVGDEYSVTGEIVNVHSHISMKHNVCGYEWNLAPLCFINKHSRCPRCANRERYTTEQAKKLTQEISKGKYILVDEYVNNYTPMKILHVECDQEFEIPFTNILQEIHYCPFCFSNMQSISRGERKIKDYLIRNNIEYERECAFEGCYHIKLLQFDFAVFKDKKLMYLIEFDGRQHYEPIDFFGGEEGFKSTQKRDEIKNQYCKKRNIPLIRIPYWDIQNIDSILDEILKL